jgi:acetyl esterase
VRLLAGTPITDGDQALDPLVQFMLRFFSDPPGKLASVEETRAGFDRQGDWLTHEPAPDIDRRPITVPGPAGPITCEQHRPRRLGAAAAPALLFFHGGGHVAGSLRSHRSVCRQLAADGECVVIAADYRLAPEDPFPAGIDDSLAAYDAVVGDAAALGLDPDRIAVGGDSAGGNIAAVVAQQRRAAAHPPRFQILWAPWLDLSKQSASYESFATGFFLEKPKMEWYTDHYLRTEPDALDPRASPLLGDVAEVCPAAILVAGFDPLRDEGLAYGRKLAEAGVSAVTRTHEGLVHPFINFGGCVPAASAAFDDATALLRSHLAISPDAAG